MWKTYAKVSRIKEYREPEFKISKIDSLKEIKKYFKHVLLSAIINKNHLVRQGIKNVIAT